MAAKPYRSTAQASSTYGYNGYGSSTSSSTAASSPLQTHQTNLYYVQSPRGSSVASSALPYCYYSTEDDKFSERRTPFSSAPSSPFHHPALGQPLPAPPPHPKFLPPSSRFQPPHSQSHAAAVLLKSVAHSSTWTALDDESAAASHHCLPHTHRRLMVFPCWVYFVALIIMTSSAFLITWIACLPRGSQLTIQRINVIDFALFHGSDRTQVPTDMMFVKSRVELSFSNPSKYFRFAFHPTFLTMSYLGVPIAHGKVSAFDLRQKSTSSIEVEMDSPAAPLYGAGLNFELAGTEVSVQLTSTMDMHVNILWNVITRQIQRNIECHFFVNIITLKVLQLTCN